jgi:lysophospholipase L1-like esterase
MATGFTDGMLADDIHYNQAGAAFIAERYYDKLVPFLD